MIERIAVENFKAIYKKVDFPVQPFTVFIGNNGTGKSSVIEALRLLKLAAGRGLDKTFEEYGRLDKIRNYNSRIDNDSSNKINSPKIFSPLTIALTALVNENKYEYEVRINTSADGFYIVESEKLTCNGGDVLVASITEDTSIGKAILYNSIYSQVAELDYTPNRLWLGYERSYMSDELNEFADYVENWQFLYLNAHVMGQPVLQEKLFRTPRLKDDGSNIANYLLWIKSMGQEYIDSLIRKMRFVLPYIDKLESHVLEGTKNPEVELLLYEKNKNREPLPGWLLSSGTLRVLALLAMFETPEKPSVLFIDEIENGLDPRTIGLFLSEVENVFDDKSMQVILTTHSPYLLDLVSLENIIVVEKENEGSSFYLPNDEQGLKLWKEKFSSGKLYTMGKLTE